MRDNLNGLWFGRFRVDGFTFCGHHWLLRDRAALTVPCPQATLRVFISNVPRRLGKPCGIERPLVPALGRSSFRVLPYLAVTTNGPRREPRAVQSRKVFR